MFAVHDALCVLEVLDDILPSNDRLAILGIQASRDGDDFGGPLGPEGLQG